MAKMAKILIVDDEPAVREMIGFALTRAGFQFVEAGDTEQARAQLTVERLDLILLDWMLPGQSGLEFIRYLQREPATRELPVIMLTARSEESNKILGLEAGADDYVTKPFSPQELLARVKAVLRRVGPVNGQEVLDVQGLRLDPSSHRVSVNAKAIAMGPTEFRLLHFFMLHAERVFSRTQLLDQVWGDQVYVEERTVDVHIRRLRKALESTEYHRLIQTVRGAGYRFSTQE